MLIQCIDETTRNQASPMLLTRVQMGTTLMEENLAVFNSLYARLPGDLETDIWRPAGSFYTIYNWKQSRCLT